MRSFLLASAALCVACPAFAQTAEAPATEELGQGDIIVTATQRAQSLSDVPIAVSAISGETLQNSGAVDLRTMNQLSPSLLVSSTSSEAGAAVIRVRGIGTVGDNPGLESSVAVFIDGVYRSRGGVALTELGAVDRVEVLRGPQGTLFGRNASAGLIHIITAKPKFETEGMAEVTYGNFDFWRIAGGITGALVDDKLAYRVDGVWTRRDGFIKDVISGRTVNNRDRYLLRGQLLYTPNDDLEVRLIGDFAERNEECCASSYLPFRTSFRDAQGNVQVTNANPVVDTIRKLGGVISDDTFARTTSITPGRNYRSDVTDWGLSGELKWNLGFADLTSITAWRDWRLSSGQDADFNNLDILNRDNQTRRFRTFSQELRLNGVALNDRLDWLVGAYFANETLDLADNLKYGADYMRYANAIVRLSVPTFPGYEAIAAAVGRPGDTLNGRGITGDTFNQTSRNFAIFTHNVFDIVPDKLQLTLGGRYTNERKTLDVSLNSDNTLCAAIAGSPSPQIRGLATLPCVINPINNFNASDTRNEDEFTGTVVLSWKPIPELLTYASYSVGYKAGGFNLDRSALNPAAPDLAQLQFAEETVDSWELGAKLDLPGMQINVAAFRAVFDQFQLNTFNGTNFIVENIQSCSDDLNGGDRDFAGLPVSANPVVPQLPNTVGRSAAQAAATGQCPGNVRGGVTSTGLEVETLFFPVDDLTVSLGLTYVETRYRNNLVGIGGRPFPTPLFNLPGQPLSNAPDLAHTGAVTWTPAVNDSMRALFYVDWRLQSDNNTGSDLFPEKRQEPVVQVNARLGLNGNDSRWAVEVWAQNLFNEQFQQVAFNTPLQGGGTVAQTARGGPNATTMFGSFLAEPRQFGVTLRTRF
jgi:outer membrane receptor protein involved in Fe transport